jgi:hypothetical protein
MSVSSEAAQQLFAAAAAVSRDLAAQYAPKQVRRTRATPIHVASLPRHAVTSNIVTPPMPQPPMPQPQSGVVSRWSEKSMPIAAVASMKHQERLHLLKELMSQRTEAEWKKLRVTTPNLFGITKEESLTAFQRMRNAHLDPRAGLSLVRLQRVDAIKTPNIGPVMVKRALQPGQPDPNTPGMHRNMQRVERRSILGPMTLEEFNAHVMRFDPNDLGVTLIVSVSSLIHHSMIPKNIAKMYIFFDSSNEQWYVSEHIDTSNGNVESQQYWINEVLRESLAKFTIKEFKLVRNVDKAVIQDPRGANGVDSNCLFRALDALTQHNIANAADLVRADVGLPDGPIHRDDVHKLEEVYGVGINVIHNIEKREIVIPATLYGKTVTVRLCAQHYVPVNDEDMFIDREKVYLGEHKRDRKPLSVIVPNGNAFTAMSLGFGPQVSTQVTKKTVKWSDVQKMNSIGAWNKFPRVAVVAPQLPLDDTTFFMIQERLNTIHQYSMPHWSPYRANTQHCNLMKPQDVAYSWWRATLEKPVRIPTAIEAAIAGNAFAGGLIQAARKSYSGPAAMFDITSCYAAMMRFPLPVGTPRITRSERFQDTPHRELPHGFYSIEASREVIEREVPSRFRYNKSGIYTAIDVMEMKRLGYPIVMRGVAMIYDESEMSSTLFKEFIDAAFLLKQAAAGTSGPNKSFMKMIVTSLWGQLGKRGSCKVSDENLTDVDVVVPSKLTDHMDDVLKVHKLDRRRYSRLPNIAAYVTAYGRWVLNTYADIVTRDDRSALLEFSTDGFIATRWDSSFESETFTGEISKRLGSLRFENRGTIEYEGLYCWQLHDSVNEQSKTRTTRWTAKHGDH